MRWLTQWFVIEPEKTPEGSAVWYVPLVMLSRALAFLRTLLVARLLSEAGKVAFGLYQPALELINPVVAMVLFGAADVAERYVARIERERGIGGLKAWLVKQWLRVGLAGLGAAIVMAMLSPWISDGVWGREAGLARQVPLVVACAITVLLLALYQHVAAALRGLRAYRAAGAMELLSAGLLLVLSAAAAPVRDATWLIVAYAASVFVPLVVLGGLLWRFLKGDAATVAVAPPATGVAQPHMTRFGAWTLVRLLLVMLFGFLSLWGVRFLAQPLDMRDASSATAVSEAGQYAMPFRVAQLLGFLAVTMWASSYGIAARAWSHGQTRRATVQLFRVGRFGAAALTMVAVALLLMRGVFAWLLPGYSESIENLLPGLLAVFIGYAFLTFFCALADLREQPQRGAFLWGLTVALQLAGIFWCRRGGIEAKQGMVVISAIGMAVPLVLLAPFLLCRPLKFTPTGVPLTVMGISAITLFCPEWVVDWIASPVMLGAVMVLFVTGLLVRPMDRRVFRRRRQRQRGPAAPPAPPESRVGG